MRIAAVEIYEVEAVAHGGGQKLSGGRVVAGFTSFIARLSVDGPDGAAISGWGEAAPYGSVYLPMSAGAARAALRELAPALIGQDVRQIAALQARLDARMMGHGFAKIALEMAAWDAIGRLTGWPLWAHFGGMLSPEPQISAHIGAPADGVDVHAARIERYRRQRLRQFSAKASGDWSVDADFARRLVAQLRPGESVKLDANGGWRVDQGLRVARAIGDAPFWLEQPCATYEECRDLRRACGIPMVLDECATDLSVLIRAQEDRVLDAVSLKPARVGGVRQTLAMRDLLVALGKPMHVQDVAGTDIVNAMIAHLAHATPTNRLLYVWDAHNLIKTVTAEGGPDGAGGRLIAGDGPGLGVQPIAEALGAPIARFD